jgi:YidC/Oxa1 family membrane protein insertase
MENSRLYIFFALSALILVGWYFLVPTPPPVPVRPVQTAGSPTTGSGTVAVPTPGAAPSVAPPGRGAVAAAAVGKRILVDTPLYVAEVDTRGGTVVSFRLKQYRQHKASVDWGDVLPFTRSWLGPKPPAGTDLIEMVRRELPGQELLGLQFVGNDDLTKAFSEGIFAASADSVTVRAEDATGKTLTLTRTGPGGLTVEKQIVFHPDRYVLDYGVNLLNYGREPRAWRVVSQFGQGPAANDTSAQRGTHQGPIERDNNKIHKHDVGDIDERLVIKDPQWLAIADAYFLSAARATTPVAGGLYVAQSPPGTTLDKKLRHPAYGLELPETSLAPGMMVANKFVLYLGPKNTDEMLKFGQRLEESLDLTIEIIAAPMLAMLRWFNSFTGNYGIAIILLTIVVRVVLFPLTYRGMVSMKRMQKLQPRMAALKEKFKNDRDRMKKETMELYRKHKINPLGGCLPIVVQIPIFFALYSALISAIELRHAPFFLWIADLSAHDGLFVMPVIMGGTMFAQQRLTPSSLDPTQAKIMMWMPVVFTLFMFTFPSGLMVYWSTSNLLSITQQILINRVKVPEPAEG